MNSQKLSFPNDEFYEFIYNEKKFKNFLFDFKIIFVFCTVSTIIANFCIISNILELIQIEQYPKGSVIPCGEIIGINLITDNSNYAIQGAATLSFVDPITGNFIAVGHSIPNNAKKSSLLKNGTIYDISNLSLQKSESNYVGTIIAEINYEKTLGSIKQNNSFGIYGNLSQAELTDYSNHSALEISSRFDIKPGKAILLSNILGDLQEFEIKIIEINLLQTKNHNCIKIRITDTRLLSEAGGIIRGMSGCPIIQDGKLIAVLSSAMSKNPSEGYALFADMLFKEME